MSLKCQQPLARQLDHDSAFFAQLYDTYFPRLYAYVRYRVPCPQDAEDIVGETFLQVLKHLRSFEWRHDGAFAAWIFRIAHNLISNFYRQCRRREMPLPLDTVPNLHDQALPPEDLVLHQEQVTQLYRLISTLSPRQQEVLTLKFFGGLPNQEIAAILALDARTVAAYLCRGLEALHQKYVGSVEGEGWSAHMYIREELFRPERAAADSVDVLLAASTEVSQSPASLAGFCAYLVQIVPQADTAFCQNLKTRLVADLHHLPSAPATTVASVLCRIVGWLRHRKPELTRNR